MSHADREKIPITFLVKEKAFGEMTKQPIISNLPFVIPMLSPNEVTLTQIEFWI